MWVGSIAVTRLVLVASVEPGGAYLFKHYHRLRQTNNGSQQTIPKHLLAKHSLIEVIGQLVLFVSANQSRVGMWITTHSMQPSTDGSLRSSVLPTVQALRFNDMYQADEGKANRKAEYRISDAHDRIGWTCASANATTTNNTEEVEAKRSGASSIRREIPSNRLMDSNASGGVGSMVGGG